MYGEGSVVNKNNANGTTRGYLFICSTFQAFFKRVNTTCIVELNSILIQSIVQGNTIFPRDQLRARFTHVLYQDQI